MQQAPPRTPLVRIEDAAREYGVSVNGLKTAAREGRLRLVALNPRVKRLVRKEVEKLLGIEEDD